MSRRMSKPEVAVTSRQSGPDSLTGPMLQRSRVRTWCVHRRWHAARPKLAFASSSPTPGQHGWLSTSIQVKGSANCSGLAKKWRDVLSQVGFMRNVMHRRRWQTLGGSVFKDRQREHDRVSRLGPLAKAQTSASRRWIARTTRASNDKHRANDRQPGLETSVRAGQGQRESHPSLPTQGHPSNGACNLCPWRPESVCRAAQRR